MNLPDRCGEFLAVIQKHGLVESKAEGSQAIQWCPLYKLTHILHQGEWCDYAEYNAEIAGFHTVVGRNGEPNERGLADVANALEIKITDMAQLDGSVDYSDKTVKIVIAMEDNGKGAQTMKVKWLNHKDRQGGTLETLDKAKVTALSTRLNSKLRALAGSTPAPVAKPAVTPVKKY